MKSLTQTKARTTQQENVLFLRNNVIEYTWTNAYSPEENGLVEHMNGVVMSQIRCVLTTADMPFLLWGEAFNFAIEKAFAY